MLRHNFFKKIILCGLALSGAPLAWAIDSTPNKKQEQKIEGEIWNPNCTIYQRLQFASIINTTIGAAASVITRDNNEKIYLAADVVCNILSIDPEFVAKKRTLRAISYLFGVTNFALSALSASSGQACLNTAYYFVKGCLNFTTGDYLGALKALPQRKTT